MVKKKSSGDSFWIPMNMWNLNELFTTESISPISFYKVRDFGNPVNRNQGIIEDENNLVLFDDCVQSDILLNISHDLLNTQYLSELRSDKKAKLKSFNYSKTIYLKNGLFKLYFCSKEKLTEFLNNTFMLLEVKTVNKYKRDFVVDEIKIKKSQNAFYQSEILSDKDELQPIFDKAYNQIKGLIYGYLIGSIGTLGEKEQSLISDLSKLKNTIGGIHTDIVLSEQYSDFWLINVHCQIKDCQKAYFDNFSKYSDDFDTLLLRVIEINNLNKMRCIDLERQKSHNYRRAYETERENLENAKRVLYKYEYKHEITPLKEELDRIKKDEENKGKSKGKSREYYKKGTEKYNRKQELKQLISCFENDTEYQELKKQVEKFDEKVRNFQFGFSQYDSSITEQFSRISEYLHEITKKATSFFLAKNNKSSHFPKISFELNIKKLTDYYFNQKKEYTDFAICFPRLFTDNFTESELNLISVCVNSILTQPQGRLGNNSEQNILDIIKSIGEHLSENSVKQILRNYYLYRIGKTDSFSFPENQILGNLLVFFMKLNGPEQINKMLVTKNITHKQIAFMFYGAYVGFANMPKTFTNVIFDSNNTELFDYIDNYLFNNVLSF